MSGTVFDIQRCSMHDGPGIRTTVFLKGCPLSCLWCHNPESQKGKAQVALFKDKCALCACCEKLCENDAHKVETEHDYNRENCVVCGKCVDSCPTGALKVYGYEITSQEILEIVKKDEMYYKNSGGGVTVSGGEPFFQHKFLKELLTLFKSEGIHTCVETSGFVRGEILEDIAPLVDMFLYDYKATGESKHKELTGVSNSLIMSNLNTLYEMGKDIILRCPIIPGCNDSDEHFEKIAKMEKEMPNLCGIEILIYHNLGVNKAKAVGMDCLSQENPDSKAKDKIRQRLKKCGCSEKIINSF